MVHNAQLCEVERGWSIYHDVGPNGHVAGHLEEHLRVKESNKSGREPTMIHMDLTVDHWVAHPSIVEDSSWYGRQISCLCPISPLKTTVTTPGPLLLFSGHHTQPKKEDWMTDLPLSTPHLKQLQEPRHIQTGFGRAREVERLDGFTF